MVGAAQPRLLRDSENHAGPAVGAPVADEAQRATAIAIEDEVLPQQPNRARAVSLKLGARSDGVPIAAHQLAARRTASHQTEAVVLFLCKHGPYPREIP